MQHPRLASIVAKHSTGDVARVRDVRGRPRGGARVPLDQTRDHRARKPRRSEAADVLVIGKREPADGVDVADVNRVRAKANAFRPSGRRTDDKIVRREIEAFERPGIERREPAEAAARERDALQPRGADSRGVDQIAGRFRVEQRGVDRGIGVRARDVREDALRAAALVEIIVDERDALVGYEPPADERGKTSATM